MMSDTPKGAGYIKLGAFVVVAWLAVSFFAPDEWKIRYCARYFVTLSQIIIDQRSTKCDWNHAPLGDKACHYAKIVLTTSWKTGPDGRTLVSYDEGQTWNDSLVQYKDLPEEYVHVTWDKKEDP